MGVKVVFVCTGNICRSPAGHAVLAHRLAQSPRGASIEVDSCGIGGWHADEPPDPRAVREGKRRGYRVDHPARQVQPTDFTMPALIVAMGKDHLQALQRMAPSGFPKDHIVLLRSFDPASAPGADVADPYYGADEGFSTMYDVIEAAMPGLLEFLHAPR